MNALPARECLLSAAPNGGCGPVASRPPTTHKHARTHTHTHTHTLPKKQTVQCPWHSITRHGECIFLTAGSHGKGVEKGTAATQSAGTNLIIERRPADSLEIGTDKGHTGAGHAALLELPNIPEPYPGVPQIAERSAGALFRDPMSAPPHPYCRRARDD